MNLSVQRSTNWASWEWMLVTEGCYVSALQLSKWYYDTVHIKQRKNLGVENPWKRVPLNGWLTSYWMNIAV